jgi:hypothetical protein
MWKIVLFITVVIGLILYERIVQKKKKVDRHERANLWNKRGLEKFGDREKIFVVLSGYSWPELKNTIHNIYNGAYLPQRVVVGAAVSPTEITQSAAEDAFKDFGFQVKLYVHPEHYNLGGAPTRKLVLERLYKGEPYVLLMHAHSKMAPQWDATLTASLKEAFKKGCHLVTQIPLEVKRVWITPKDHVPATFPVLHTDTLRNKLPTFSGRTFAKLECQYEVPCISSKCLFGTASVIKLLTDHTVPLLMAHEDDFVLSAISFGCGARAATPLRSVLYHIQDPMRSHTYTDYESEQLTKYKENVIGSLLSGNQRNDDESCPTLLDTLGIHCNLYIKWLGTQVFSGELPGHLILGLPRQYQEREVLDKFGDMKTFQAFRRKFCYD